MEAAGISGTDRHLYPGECPCTPPLTLGREFSRNITATGDGVSMHLDLRDTCDPPGKIELYLPGEHLLRQKS